MRALLVVILSVSLLGCSTLKKSKTYGAIAGGLICGVLGSAIGKEVSPNPESEGVNKVIYGAGGAAACGLTGYLVGTALYEDDPRNHEYDPMKFEDPKKQITPQEQLNTGLEGLDLSDLSIVKEGEAQVPLVQSLPDSLKSKVPKQKVIKYQINPQIIKTKDGKLLYFSGGQAIEHKYEKAQ